MNAPQGTISTNAIVPASAAVARQPKFSTQRANTGASSAPRMPVIDSVTALAVYDLLAGRYGTDYFIRGSASLLER